MIEDKPIQVEYRKLNPICAYCHDKATAIRVTITKHGSVIVSTLCEKDAEGEKKQAIKDGFIFNGQTSIAGMVSDSSLIDPSVIKEFEKDIEKAYEDHIKTLKKDSE